MVGPRALVLLVLVVGLCLNECDAAKKKKPCKWNKQKFKAGEVIEALEDHCVQLMCSEKGKKIELNPIEGCVCGKEVTDGPEPTDGPKPTDGSGGGGGGDCNCDYSDFDSSHTMNKYTGPDAKCGAEPKTGVTDDDIKTILKTHNELREKVAKGEEKLGSPGPQPKAKNMFELKWNCELAEVAQRWAERCTLGHDKGDDRKICNKDYYVGQNAYMAWGFDPASAWEGAINSWYSEVKDMPKNLVDSFGSTGAVIGHYTQVIWAETYEVGCGAIHFPDSIGSTTYPESKVYVCNYGAGGNWLGSKIYESGKTASNCPNGVSVEFKGLCAPPS